MPRKTTLFFIFSYLIVSVLQFVASIDGIMHFFGLHWIFAFFAAFLLLAIPAIGPLAGVYGAVAAWGWPVWASLLLFFWPYVLYALLFLCGVRISLSFWKKRKNAPPQEIEASYVVKNTQDL